MVENEKLKERGLVKAGRKVKPLIFIVNPIAGSHQKDNIIEAVKVSFSATRYIIEQTSYKGHAREIAEKYLKEGCKKIIAVGGDGTVNEVASAIAGSGCSLGIIPAGSGNGLARYLGIPSNISEALSVIKNHKIRIVDAGRANGRYFFCTCGTGFDATVGEQFARNSRRGMLRYLRATIHQYISYAPKSYVLKINGKKIKLKAFLITFANSGQYGNNAYIAPNALIDDGMLDLAVLRPFPKSSTLELGLRLFFKNIDQSPYLELMRVKKVIIKRKAKKKNIYHIDGEPLYFKKKLKIKVIPQAIHVMVPASKLRYRPLRINLQ